MTPQKIIKGDNMNIENKISIVNEKIEELENNESKRQFFKEKLLENQNNGYGNLVVYYDFDVEAICCESITTGTIIPNTLYLADIRQDIDLNEMETDELDAFVEYFIESLSNMNDWILYDSKGDKILIA